MEISAYASKLETKLVEEFKQKFRTKLGYEPIVITKPTLKTGNNIPVVSMEELEEIFEPYLPMKRGKKLGIRDVARYRELVELRQIFCVLAREMKYTLVGIGQYLGRRDHTTIIHSITTFKNLVEIDEQIKKKYLLIVHDLKNKYDEPSIMEHISKTQFKSESDLPTELL
jgi:hypothetical protein